MSDITPAIVLNPATSSVLESSTSTVNIKAPAANIESTDSVFKDRTPSNWEINATDDEEGIRAYNIRSFESFEGTLTEFNAKLRG